MSKHTSGPWNLVKRKNNEVKIEHADRRTKGASSLTIAKVTVCDSWFAEQMANARLIAAAPDLLEATKACAAVCAGETMSKNALITALEQARAAIAKATEEA